MAQNEIRITVTASGAAEAAKVLADVAKSGAQLGSVTVTGAKRAEDALASLGGTLASLGGTARRVLEIFTGFTLGNIMAQIASFAQRSVVELTRMGLENQRVEESFTRMAKSVGASAEALSESLRRASGGIADANDTMLASSKALAQGLNSDQLVKIMETARAQATLAGTTVAEAFNQIAESVTNLQVKQLRSFGIVIDLEKAYEDYARALGVVKEQLTEVGQRAALLQAIDEQTRKNRAALTEGERTNAQEIERSKAIWSDYFATIAGGFATAYAGSVKWSARFLEQVTIEKQRIDELGVSWANYLAAKLKGTGLEPQTRTSAADVQALRDMGDAATNMSQSLPTLSGHTKALAVDFKALAAEAKKVAEEIQKSHVAAAEAAIADTERELAMLLEITNKRLAEEAKLLEQGNAGWVAHAEAIEQSDYAGLAAELAITNARLAEEKAALDATNAGWVAHAESVIAATEQELGAIEKINAPLRAYQDTLDDIALKGKLFGSSFDALAPTISAVTAEIVRLGKAGEDVTALQEKLAGLKQVQELKGIFSDVFSSIGSAISTSIQGVILGTQTMAKAWDNLWKSIVLSFVNSGIQRLLKGLQDWALDFLFGKSSSGGGGGLVGALGGGGGGGSVSSVDAASGGGFNVTTATNAVGDFTTALQFATNGTSSFTSALGSVSSIGAGLWGAAGGAGGALGPAFTGVGAVDVAIAGGSLTEIGSAASAAVGPISAMSVGLSGVGAAVAAFGTIMDFVNGKTEAAVGGLVGGVTGAVAGGLIGAYFGPGGIALGALAGEALGDWLGSMLGGLFGGPSNYELQRAKAADAANAYLGNTTQGYQSALNTRSPAQILAALQSTGTGVNPLRTELVLSSQVAAQLGITGEREGDNIIARWTDVNEAQMNELIALFKFNPDMVAGAVRGAGDVGYLPQDKAHEFSAQLELGAEALLTAFSSLGAVTDKINEVANDLTAAAKEALPPGLAQEFADGIVTPIRDRMLAVLHSGLPAAEMEKQLNKINVELQGKVEAWNQFAVAIKQATVVDALIPDNLHAQFRAAMEPAYDAMLEAMRNGTAAQAKLQAEHFATQTRAWAAFSDAAQGALNVEALLPEDLGERFDAAMQPIYDKILASLVAGNGAIALAQTQTFARLTAAWASIGQTVTRITGELAGLTGTLEGSVETWVAVQRQMDGAVLRAQAAFEKAVSGGDVERIAATAAALHDATLARLQAEMAMVKQIEAAMTAMLHAASGLVNLVTTIAQMEIAMSGSIGTIQSLLGALEGMATSGATTAQRLWAVQAAIEAIVAVLPGLIEQFASFSTALEWLTNGMQTAEQLRVGPGGPAAITGAVITGAAPFLGAQQAEIDAATGSAKLALLQQQAADVQSLAAAAIAGVKQWAQAAITGARAAAAEVITGARAEADRRIDVARTEAARRQALLDVARDKALAAIDAEIEGTQAAAAAEQEMRRAQMDALTEMIAKSQEWESAVEGMGKFIQSLKVSPLGPGNPADKLRQSQDAFGKALQAFSANPTAGGLTDLQGLAQTMLALAEPIFSKPSPQFQTLSATTLKQLTAAQAMARAQVSDSAVLKLQLDQLRAMDKAATQAAQDTLDALREEREAITKAFDQQTQDLSAALENYIGGIATALETYIGEVEAALVVQTTAIEKAAKDEIDAINVALIGALKDNAAAQVVLVKEQGDKIDVLIGALTSSEFEGVRLGDIATYAAQRQDVAIGILESIRNGIALAVGQPLAQGSARVTEGLYHLHNDEMVIPKHMADRIRSAADGAGLPTDPGTLMGIVDNWATYSAEQQAGIIAAYNALDPGQQQAVTNTISYWSVASDPKNTAAIKKNYADVPVGFRFEDFWAEKAHFTKTGQGIYAPGYGPGATPGSVVQNVTPGAPPPPVIPPMPPPPKPPPPVPPYVPPSPPWLSRGAGATAASGASGAAYSAEDYGGGGSGPVTIIVKLDGRTIGEATLPTVQADARRGKLQTIILETRPR